MTWGSLVNDRTEVIRSGAYGSVYKVKTGAGEACVSPSGPPDYLLVVCLGSIVLGRVSRLKTANGFVHAWDDAVLEGYTPDIIHTIVDDMIDTAVRRPDFGGGRQP